MATAPSTSPGSRTTAPTGPAGRISPGLAGAAALLAGALSVASGVVQLLYPQDEDPAIDTPTRFVLAMFTVSLWALAVLFLGLARRARAPWGAWVASAGTVLLTVGTVSSAVNGEDLAFFPAVAMAANALWLVGAIGLTVSLVRSAAMSRWLTIPLALLQVPLLFLSQVGGGVPAGAYLLALGGALVTGRALRD